MIHLTQEEADAIFLALHAGQTVVKHALEDFIKAKVASPTHVEVLDDLQAAIQIINQAKQR